MGMPAAPQIANLACYPVEKAHSYILGPGKTSTITRYIDDFSSSGVPLPTQEAYGMAYIKTAEGNSVVYLGVKVYIEQHNDNKKEVHLTVHDREEEYPHHIVRYPEFGTVAPQQQLGGVIMGRLVHCQETCSHMKDFKESVGNVFRNAMWRGYPRRLVQSVWSRFLFQRWHSTDIRVKELRVWFSKIWTFLSKTGGQTRPDPSQHAETLRSLEPSSFLQVFGIPRNKEAKPKPKPAPSNPRQASSSSPVPSNPPVPPVTSATSAPLPPQQEQQRQPQPQRPTEVMDVDEEDWRLKRRAEKRPAQKRPADPSELQEQDEEAFQLPLQEARAAENQRLYDLNRALAAPQALPALPAPQSLPMLPAPPSDEVMTIDPEDKNRKRPREEENEPEAERSVVAGIIGPSDESTGANGQADHMNDDDEDVSVLLRMSSVERSQEIQIEGTKVTLTEETIRRQLNIVYEACSPHQAVSTSSQASSSSSTSSSTSSSSSSDLQHSQPSSKKQRIKEGKQRRTYTPILEWSEKLRAEYKEFRAASDERQKALYLSWARHERRCVYSIAVHSRPKMKTWKAEEQHHGRIAERPVVQSSNWVHDVTQDGDVELNPGPPKKTQLRHNVKRRYEENLKIAVILHRSVAGDKKGASRGPSPRPHKPSLPEPHQRIGHTT